MWWGDIASSDGVWVLCNALAKFVFWVSLLFDCHCTAGKYHFCGRECRAFDIKYRMVNIRPVGMHTMAAFHVRPRGAVFRHVFSTTESILSFRLGAICCFMAILWVLSTHTHTQTSFLLPDTPVHEVAPWRGRGEQAWCLSAAGGLWQTSHSGARAARYIAGSGPPTSGYWFLHLQLLVLVGESLNIKWEVGGLRQVRRLSEERSAEHVSCILQWRQPEEDDSRNTR